MGEKDKAPTDSAARNLAPKESTSQHNSAAGGRDERPLLVYDGDCAFCAYWVRYWRRLTGVSVHYAPYQETAAAHPEVAPAEFAGAIQLFLPDGRRCSGAEAAFRVLAEARGHGSGLWLYRHVPGFGLLSERVYALIARHRPAAHWWARRLWGDERYPAEYRRVSWLFLRLLGLIYFSGFASVLAQVTGLVGNDGILPLGDYLDLAAAGSGAERYWFIPTLFWINASNAALRAACIAGLLASALVVLDAWVRPMLLVAFVLYLSLWYALQLFGGVQSDVLLLEVGFLAIFLTSGSRIAVWLYRWLLFRFMLLSGLVKLLSGDKSWAQLTALKYHYETQPLPTPLAWYAHQLPDWFQQLCVLAVFGIELLLPWLVFLPRRPRFVAAWGFIVLQSAIALTGNYHFLNLLTLCLTLLLFDDAAVRRLLPARLGQRAGHRMPLPGRTATATTASLAILVLVSNATQAWATFGRNPPEPLASVAASVSRLGITNLYGFFAVINTTRYEIIVEGSRDGEHWKPYEFRYKPGDPYRRPTWNIPHQPRLDWEMWFAAAQPPYLHPWLGAFMQRLLEGSPDVLGLLASDPFPGKPPTYVRSMLYRYRFTDAGERASTGAWWKREPAGYYLPPMQRWPVRPGSAG